MDWKKNIIVFVMTLAMAPGLTALAATEVFDSERVDEIVELRPTAYFIPVGFDDNDEVVVVVDGYLPDTCHKLRAPTVKVDEGTQRIFVQPRAQVFLGNCNDLAVPYSTVVRLGSLPNGNYTVSTKDGVIKERLEIKKSANPGPDDFLYLPIDSIQVLMKSGGKMVGVIYGRFTSTCSKLDEIKIINSGKTLEVLPVMRQLTQTENGSPCEAKEIPFEHRFNLPDLKPGRYLLHVRSLNGQSANEIFTNHWE